MAKRVKRADPEKLVGGLAGLDVNPITVRPAGRPPTKQRTNLTIDPAAVARGEAFSGEQGVSLSQLVTDFLYALPSTSGSPTAVMESFSPPVRRLFGVALNTTADRDLYRTHLQAKYDRE